MAQTKAMDKRRNYYAVVVLGEEQYEGKIFESWPDAELEIKVCCTLFNLSLLERVPDAMLSSGSPENYVESL